MSLTYATTADLSAEPWSIDPLPSNTGLLLAQASRLVRRATMLARYVVDETGAPRDATVGAALRDATCAQVSGWLASGVNPSTGRDQPSGAVVQSKKLGSAAVVYDTSAAASVTAMSARARAATELSQDAYLILADAGLTSVRPGTVR